MIRAAIGIACAAAAAAVAVAQIPAPDVPLPTDIRGTCVNGRLAVIEIDVPALPAPATLHVLIPPTACAASHGDVTRDTRVTPT